MKKPALVIAIDGPGGSGKSTLARKVALKLNILYIDTGAMYRGLALAAGQSQIPFQEGSALSTWLNQLQLQYGPSAEKLIQINGENFTKLIRDHQVSTLASQFSQLPSVRKYLVEFQRRLGEVQFCVMEGRDIGTVVFPEAFCKIFLTANLQIRAQRRMEELKAKGQTGLSYEQVVQDVQMRDQRDMERKEAPLIQAKDAVLLDTSALSIFQVEDKIIEIAKKKAQELGLKL